MGQFVRSEIIWPNSNYLRDEINSIYFICKNGFATICKKSWVLNYLMLNCTGFLEQNEKVYNKYCRNINIGRKIKSFLVL